jgi:hypothetical protein
MEERGKIKEKSFDEEEKECKRSWTTGLEQKRRVMSSTSAGKFG